MSPWKRALRFARRVKARAGMGVDVADFDNSGESGSGHHEFR